MLKGTIFVGYQKRNFLLQNVCAKLPSSSNIHSSQNWHRCSKWRRNNDTSTFFHHCCFYHLIGVNTGILVLIRATKNRISFYKMCVPNSPAVAIIIPVKIDIDAANEAEITIDRRCSSLLFLSSNTYNLKVVNTVILILLHRCTGVSEHLLFAYCNLHQYINVPILYESL